MRNYGYSVCDGCESPVPSINSAMLCEACALARADAAIDFHWRYCATRNPDACAECDALFSIRADAHA